MVCFYVTRVTPTLTAFWSGIRTQCPSRKTQLSSKQQQHSHPSSFLFVQYYVCTCKHKKFTANTDTPHLSLFSMFADTHTHTHTHTLPLSTQIQVNLCILNISTYRLYGIHTSNVWKVWRLNWNASTTTTGVVYMHIQICYWITHRQHVTLNLNYHAHVTSMQLPVENLSKFEKHAVSHDMHVPRTLTYHY